MYEFMQGFYHFRNDTTTKNGDFGTWLERNGHALCMRWRSIFFGSISSKIHVSQLKEKKHQSIPGNAKWNKLNSLIVRCIWFSNKTSILPTPLTWIKLFSSINFLGTYWTLPWRNISSIRQRARNVSLETISRISNLIKTQFSNQCYYINLTTNNSDHQSIFHEQHNIFVSVHVIYKINFIWMIRVRV